MVVPKRRESLSELARQFQRRQIEKEYTAIVWGEVAEDKGSIELPIATDWPNRPKQIICEERGKHALTHFEVLKRSNNRSLIKLKPVTGRSHQLRIHMQSLGHPIIGCDMYAHPDALEASDRLLLHATRLKLCAPSTANWLSAFSRYRLIYKGKWHLTAPKGSEVIDEFTESDARVIVVKPNKSSTWRANLYVLIAISIPSLGAAIGFTLLEPGQYSRSQARNSSPYQQRYIT